MQINEHKLGTDYILKTTDKWIIGVTERLDGTWTSVWLMQPDAHEKLLEYRKNQRS